MSSPIKCPGCWTELSVPSPPFGNSETTIASCPGCSRTFSEPEVDEIQTSIAVGRVPALTVLNVARMLGNPGNGAWVIRELREYLFLHRNQDCIRLPAIRAYADGKKMRLSQATSVSPTVWVIG
jgi:ribosomal protein S27E